MSLTFRSVLNSRIEETPLTEEDNYSEPKMVYTKGSRFGVFSGHTVRRPEFSYSQLCADQHIVVQSNKSFNRGRIWSLIFFLSEVFLFWSVPLLNFKPTKKNKARLAVCTVHHRSDRLKRTNQCTAINCSKFQDSRIPWLTHAWWNYCGIPVTQCWVTNRVIVCSSCTVGTNFIILT